jgi:hypothetical protein
MQLRSQKSIQAEPAAAPPERLRARPEGSTRWLGLSASKLRLITVERFDMLTLLIVALILAMLLSAPAWPHSRGWGYYPSGGLGLVLVVLLLFVFLRPI